MAWTDERIDLLRRLWEKGLSASQIAGEIGDGVTRNAVIGKAHRLGLKSRPSPVKTDSKNKKASGKAAKKDKNAKVTLLDLTERMCKWPIGHPGDDDFHFCGKNSVAGMPYCEAHCREAYQAQQPRKDRRPPRVRP
ncbi:global cell cycle regulator GcrA-like protein [Iodidimonas gelatinilytica]|uniref:Global cell cycle regulator GcrA-like protein n=2 Tax=Iodidimonas TaxID=2066486 RepID=A0A5A7MRP0_9PROT|nr:MULTISPECIES: GcrA family cell cycle regulator [Iodidimonas]GEQ98722.1 global cell cycle regulator GcrA-like protein [Iodidimonas gelatinilytica]GER05842.1 global cell cycle regulator GcrA-like protein [Kordiimonadales bacterium JCM 17843]GGO07099.1 global cell cycle regulator GcrA-like protein [Iodidimonas muriae]